MMSVLDDIRDGKGLKPIAFNAKQENICPKCEYFSCCYMANYLKRGETVMVGCSKFKEERKQTNVDRIRAMTDKELAKMMEMMVHGDCGSCEIHDYCFSQKGVECGEAWFNWLKEIYEC